VRRSKASLITFDNRKMSKPALSKRKKPRLTARGKLRSPQTSLCHDAANTVREMIVRGDIESGAPIREVVLSQKLKISRTPLREALKILASEGLVSIRKNQGARVSSIDLREVRELFETVAGIERNAAELAAQRHTQQELRQLEMFQDTMEKAFRNQDLDAYFDINQNAHRLIVAMAHNDVLQSLHDWIFARVRRTRRFALGAHDRWEDSIEEHRLILDALRRCQPLEAGMLVMQHGQATQLAIAGILPQRQVSPNPAISIERTTARRRTSSRSDLSADGFDMPARTGVP
jgi:DNA-binding GntR family transcriptional regulator